MTSAISEETMTPLAPELPIADFGEITFYVGNAMQAAHFYRTMFGFDIVAYSGPETGVAERAAYILRQNNLVFRLEAGLSPSHPISQHVLKHGDGVKDITFYVDDVPAVYDTVIARGAESVLAPISESDAQGTFWYARIQSYGETTHTFISRKAYGGEFAPGYIPVGHKGDNVGLHRVDHLVANVESGKMDHWVDFYRKVFGFYVLKHYDQKDISTQYSSLVSKVMANQSGTIKLPINEPADGLRKSQIQEYLDFYHAPGVQHLAIETRDIVSTVRGLRDRGVKFMTVPNSYYEELAGRVGDIRESLAALQEVGILVDRDEGGYLLQIFTQPLQDRPTVFFEIIQRQDGADGFGKGNFKALFEAIERDQDKRGNL